MIYELMKRDPAWRTVPWAMAVFAMLWPALIFRLDSGIAGVVAGNACSICLVMLLGVAAEQDASGNFLRGLPVSTREIFLARAISVAALLWLPALAGSIMVFATVPDKGIPLGAFAAFGSLVAMTAVSGLLLGWQLPRPMIIGAAIVASLIPMIVSLTGLDPLPFAIPVTLFGLAGTVAVVLWTWRVLPVSLIAAEKRQPRAIRDDAVCARPSRFAVIRQLYTWQELVWIPLIVFQGAVSPAVNMVLFLWSPRLLPGGRWLDSLPVSRRAVLWTGILPLLLSLVAGYLTGVRIGWGTIPRIHDIAETTTQSWPSSSEQRSCGQVNIMPPLEYWKPDTALGAEVIRAPWGETFGAPLNRIFGKAVYNPYAVGCANSRRFFDWQFRRATTAVYRRPVTHDDFVHGRYPRAIPGPRLQIATLSAILTLAIVVFGITALKDWYRWRRLAPWFTWSVFVLLFTAGLMPIGFWLPDGIQWVAWSLPDSWLAFLATCVGAPVVCYWPLDKIFREGELSPLPANTRYR